MICYLLFVVVICNLLFVCLTGSFLQISKSPSKAAPNVGLTEAKTNALRFIFNAFPSLKSLKCKHQFEQLMSIQEFPTTLTSITVCGSDQLGLGCKRGLLSRTTCDACEKKRNEFEMFDLFS